MMEAACAQAKAIRETMHKAHCEKHGASLIRTFCLFQHSVHPPSRAISCRHATISGISAEAWAETLVLLTEGCPVKVGRHVVFDSVQVGTNMVLDAAVLDAMKDDGSDAAVQVRRSARIDHAPRFDHPTKPP